MTDRAGQPPVSAAARRRIRWALGLWVALAVVVFQVVFDGQTKIAAIRFSHQQLQAHDRGDRVVGIAEGFRPEVRAAARCAGAIAGAIAGVGIIAVAWAARTTLRQTST